MSTISTTITHGITLTGSGAYTSPLTITSTGEVLQSGTSPVNAIYAASIATVINLGTIKAPGTTSNHDADGIHLQAGGSVLNAGYISAYDEGIDATLAAAFVNNTGRITNANYGINIENGGTAVNSGTVRAHLDGILTGTYEPGGTLSGKIGIVTNTSSGNIDASGGTGVRLASGGTLIDAGRIYGAFTAVSFGGSVSNLLVLEQGYVLADFSSGTAGLVVGSGSLGASNTLELLGSVGAGVTVHYNSLKLTNFGTVAFAAGAGNYATLDITNNAKPPTLIIGFDGPHDVIDLTTIGQNGSIVSNNMIGHSLTIGGSLGTVALQLDPTGATSFSLASDGGTGTTVTPACFCRGTRILTERGAAAVEDLAIGDRVVTVSGALRPVKWIGRRSYEGRFIRGNPGVLPITIQAGALADGVPSRDLRLSPGHGLYLDGALVKVESLLNGRSIEQTAAVEAVEYFHIELDSHDILLAEGAPAESYVDCDNRRAFHNAQEFARLYPGDDRPRWAYSAPFIDEGEALAALRRRLSERAAALGWKTISDPDLHLLVDGAPLAPERVEGARYTFRLVTAPAAIRIASRHAVPCRVGINRDPRRLGICLRRLVLHSGTLTIAAGFDNPLLAAGFHEAEAGHRWTDGDGLLPPVLYDCFAGEFVIEIEADGLAYYPVFAGPPRLDPAAQQEFTRRLAEESAAAARPEDLDAAIRFLSARLAELTARQAELQVAADAPPPAARSGHGATGN